MAITNNELITRYKFTAGLDLFEPLHTYASWKAQGYQVKKGEKAKHRITIWKSVTKKTKNKQTGEEVTFSKMIMQEACFFTTEQVEAIK